jgi:hypothetical protein
MPFPGQPDLLAFLDFLTAVFLPYSGLWRGASGIWRSSLFSRARWNQVLTPSSLQGKWKKFRHRNQLEEAARAGALAVIVRSPERWVPLPGQVVKISNASLQPIPKSQQRSGPAVEAIFPMPPKLELGARDTSSISTEQSQSNTCNGKLHMQTPILPGEMERSDFDFVDPNFGEIRKVHGLLDLPDGYTVAILPSNAKVEFNQQNDQYRPSSATSEANTAYDYRQSILSSNYNLPRALIAIVQVFFALYSLTTPSNKAQIGKYGFAAFSLTVLPYLVMSLTNLTASSITSSYPTVYLVRSEEMDEAERRGARFDGVVGLLDQNVESDVLKATYTGSHFEFGTIPDNFVISESGVTRYKCSPFSCSPFGRSGDCNRASNHLNWSSLAFCFFLSFLTLIPLAVIGGLTRFQGKNSSTNDQVSTMLWFGVNCVYGLGVPKFRQYLLRKILKMENPRSLAFERDLGHDNHFHRRYLKSVRRYVIIVYMLFFILSGPSIWGFVSVVNMLYDWGACFDLKYS